MPKTAQILTIQLKTNLNKFPRLPCNWHPDEQKEHYQPPSASTLYPMQVTAQSQHFS